ncbi:hypothetical protein EYF80_048920 [Liparis tanakae]|uniref:Uncharacterized protein n=1 Tax=Liparis tanakae TaxID=230148 RepID=A0A4Z2FJE5_9TELE|nr:hypothetical protein EYF80_048920 [Liparis tanakae]
MTKGGVVERAECKQVELIVLVRMNDTDTPRQKLAENDLKKYEAETAAEGGFTPRRERRYPVAVVGGGVGAWQRDHVITVGPVRPVFSWS